LSILFLLLKNKGFTGIDALLHDFKIEPNSGTFHLISCRFSKKGEEFEGDILDKDGRFKR
jgi:hypothetical protein